MKKLEKNLFFSMTYEFLEVYMRLQLERSPATIESYRDALTVFRHYLRDQQNIHLNSFEFSQCTKNLVLDFMEHLSAIGNKPGTWNQRLAALKSYLWFAADKNIALQSIAICISRVKACRNPKKERPILDEEALRLLFDAPGNSKMGVRDKTIMILLYDSAARIDEVLSLKKQDICLSSNAPSIHVLGKGQKERVITLTEQTCSHLQQYLSIYHPQNGPDTDLMKIVRDKGNDRDFWKPMHRVKLQNMPDVEIVRKYNSETRGLYNYYRLASNVSILNQFDYIMNGSLRKTFAFKYRTKASSIREKYMVNGIFTVDYETKQGKKHCEVYHDGFTQKKTPLLGDVDVLPQSIRLARPNRLAARVKAGVCELCGKDHVTVHMHHVRSLKNLKGTTPCELKMLAMRRRSIALCPDCFAIQHNTK